METTAALRNKNVLKIMKVVRKNPRISRPDIARELKLSGATVNALIAELVKRNIVIEEGLADSDVGRKAFLYSFNKDFSHIISINMLMGRISIELYDMIGNRLSFGKDLLFDDGQKVEKTLYSLTDAISGLLSENHVPAKSVLGIGMSVPGRVDHELGVICSLPNLRQWKNVPVKSLIEAELGIPLILDRDTNANILYLKWDEFSEEKSNMIYASIVEGIGTGVIIDDAVYHGGHGLAGETGHTTIVHDGRMCNCGNRGCVESYVSNKAIIGSYFNELKAVGKDTAECEAVLGNRLEENKYILTMAKRAIDDDSHADVSFFQAVDYLKTFFVNIINSFDPELLIIDCPWMKVNREYFNELVSGVFERVGLVGRNDIHIILNQTPDIFSKSPYILVIESLFTNISNSSLFTNI